MEFLEVLINEKLFNFLKKKELNGYILLYFDVGFCLIYFLIFDW